MAIIGDIVTLVDDSGITRKAVVISVNPDSYAVQEIKDTEDVTLIDANGNQSAAKVTNGGRVAWIRNHVSGDKILDIGCNDGSVFRGHPLVSKVTGVDLDNWNPPGYARFVQADAAKLPFPDGMFDVATLSEILEHVPDPVVVLKEARRVAKSIVFTVPNEYGWSANANPMMSWEEQLKKKGRTYEEDLAIVASNIYCRGLVDDKAMPHLGHVRYFTLETLRETFRQAGLEAHIEMLEYNAVDMTSVPKEKMPFEVIRMSFFVGWAT